MNNLYERAYKMELKDNINLRKVLIGMVVGLSISVLTIVFLLSNSSTIKDENLQLNNDIKQLQGENNVLESSLIGYKTLSLHQGLMLSTNIKTVTDNIISELDKIYYLEDIPLSRVEQRYIHKVADEYSIDYENVLGLIELESNFNKNAIGYNTNGTFDSSLMQVNSGNQEWVESLLNRECNLMNFKDNIDVGILLLHYYSDDNAHKGFTQYNRGIGGARKYYRSNLTYVTSYSKIVLDKVGKYEDRLKEED